METTGTRGQFVLDKYQGIPTLTSMLPKRQLCLDLTSIKSGADVIRSQRKGESSKLARCHVHPIARFSSDLVRPAHKFGVDIHQQRHLQIHQACQVPRPPLCKSGGGQSPHYVPAMKFPPGNTGRSAVWLVGGSTYGYGSTQPFRGDGGSLGRGGSLTNANHGAAAPVRLRSEISTRRFSIRRP